MRQEIFLFLQSAGFEISPSTLSNIQGKEYRNIFEYLVLILDPMYMFSAGRFEDDFTPALKALRYPYAHSIDNKWLAAPASMHSWPPLLGVLHWLVEMCKVGENRSIRFKYANVFSSTVMNTLPVVTPRSKIHLASLMNLMTLWTTMPLPFNTLNMHTKCGWISMMSLRMRMKN
jgi:hypothetical protein